MKTILTPIDFSAVSDSVVREATALARALDGRIVLLTAVQPPVVMSEYAALMDIGEITAAGERNAVRQLERLEQQLRAESIPTESIHVVGSPVVNILDQATKTGADYIVMGSHGHTAFYDLLVGSTTHGVLMRSKCPVIIVPTVKDEKTRRPAKASQSVAV